jgi:hypothetical protein
LIIDQRTTKERKLNSYLCGSVALAAVGMVSVVEVAA